MFKDNKLKKFPQLQRSGMLLRRILTIFRSCGAFVFDKPGIYKHSAPLEPKRLVSLVLPGWKNLACNLK
jgi:hypothetical protein